jgi:hypothetical protein
MENILTKPEILNDEEVALWFETLPKNLQNAILEINLHQKISLIGDSFKLNQDSKDMLENEVFQFLSRLTTPEEFEQNIFKNFKLSEIDGVSLLSKLDEEIFTPIEDKLGIKNDTEVSDLTKSVAPVVKEEDFNTKITNLGQKNNLHIDELGQLKEEVGKAVDGKILSKDLPPIIKSKFKWDDVKYSSVIKDVNEIFTGINQNLKEVTKKPVDVLQETREVRKDTYREGIPSKEDIMKEMGEILNPVKTEVSPVVSSVKKPPVNRLEMFPENKKVVETEVKKDVSNDPKDFLAGNFENTGEATNKPQTQLPPKNELFEQKLIGASSPKAEIVKIDIKPPETKDYKKVDPYREPVK